MSGRRVVELLAAPFVRLGRGYAEAAAKRPFAVGCVTTGLKTSAADMFAQLVRPQPLHTRVHAPTT